MLGRIEEFRFLLRSQKLGKFVSDCIYIHMSAIEDTEIETWAWTLAGQYEIPAGFDLLKFSPAWENGALSFLWYPTFMEEAFPPLVESWSLSPSGVVLRRTYPKNPPILHRKEAFLRPDHPMAETFRALTETAEKHGLFEDTCRIGSQNYWAELLLQKGLRVQGNKLLCC